MLKLCSNESINFQTKVKSPLAMDFIKIFQECIDKRESIPNVLNRITEVPRFFKQISIPKIKIAIKTHTGITCDDIKCSRTISLGWACLMKLGEIKKKGSPEGLTAHDVINRYSGLDTDPMLLDYMRMKKITPKTAEDMEIVVKSLNRDTGKFANTKLANKLDCTMTLFFDIYGSFLIKECGHDKLDYLTAEEITGIILHEIGHMVSCLAHSADACFRMSVYNRSMEYFIENAEPAEKVKYVKQTLSKMKDLKNSDKAVKSIDICTAVDQGAQNGPWFLNVFQTFINIFMLMFHYVSVPVILTCDILIGFFKEVSPLFVNLPAWNPDKKSDFYGLPNQTKICEQFADEYVAKHGMSAGQASGLSKIFEYSSYSGLGSMLSANKTSCLFYYINKINFTVISIFSGDLSDGGGLYDRQTARVQHLLFETAKAFKNGDMDPDMAEFFIKDYEECKKVLNNPTLNNQIRNASQWVHDAIAYIAGTLPAMFISGRFDREYERLYNSAQKLMANSLFYRATKLKQLLYKR